MRKTLSTIADDLDWRWTPLARAFAIAAALLLIALVALALSQRASAHDLWINKGAYKNPAGEWCCGAGDCGVVDKGAVHAKEGGYSVIGGVTYGAAITDNAADGNTAREQVNDFIPYSQALPSPDGAYWRCRRPDGGPRCFFAPPPGS